MKLPPEEGHHLCRVLRRRPGDAVILLPREGGALDGVIASAEERDGRLEVCVRVLGEAEGSEKGLLPWTVAVALVKGESFELALRLATELGLEGLVPVISARTVVRWKKGSEKLARWERIAREAAKQCGRSRPLSLRAPLALGEFLSGWKEITGKRPLPPRGWLAVPSGPEGLQAFRGIERLEETPFVFLVGPEGGFTEGEVARGREAGFEPTGFPVPTLRTPTAVALIAALGLVLRILR